MKLWMPVLCQGSEFWFSMTKPLSNAFWPALEMMCGSSDGLMLSMRCALDFPMRMNLQTSMMVTRRHRWFTQLIFQLLLKELFRKVRSDWEMDY